MAFDFLGGYWWVKECRYIQRYCDQRPSFLLTRSRFSRRMVPEHRARARVRAGAKHALSRSLSTGAHISPRVEAVGVRSNKIVRTELCSLRWRRLLSSLLPRLPRYISSQPIRPILPSSRHMASAATSAGPMAAPTAADCVDITRDNFQAMLPMVEQKLQECTFFAIDCEMTGEPSLIRIL